MITEKDQTEREKFEAYCRANGIRTEVCLGNSEKYFFNDTEARWQAWQARAALDGGAVLLPAGYTITERPNDYCLSKNGNNILAICKDKHRNPSFDNELLEFVRALHQSALRTAPQQQSDGTPMPILFQYKNYRGEVSRRSAIPKRLWHGSTEYHPVAQWILTAFDTEKRADRDFALQDMDFHFRPQQQDEARDFANAVAASLAAVLPLLKTVQQIAPPGDHDETIARAQHNLAAFLTYQEKHDADLAG